MATVTELGRKARHPAWVTPMLATLTNDYFSDPDWIFEPKLDGIRGVAFKRGDKVKLLSRNKLDLAGRFPELITALERQEGDFVLDGEIAAVKGNVTSFSLLQQVHRQHVDLTYFVFDMPFADGRDIRRVSVLERKRALKKRLRWHKPMSYVDHISEHGEAMFNDACKRRLEGIIAKRAESPYAAGRSRDWLKFKCSLQQELVIGGYTDPQGSRVGFGALLVGYYEGKNLHYAGKVGTGFTETTLADLLRKMKPLVRDESPFEGKPPLRKGVHWLQPKLVGQVGFSEWTGDGRLRHPRFMGLRVDKKPREVVRES